MHTLEQRAAFAAIAAQPDLKGIGHRRTQPRDEVKAWRTWEQASAVWHARRRGQFAIVVPRRPWLYRREA